MADYVGTCDDDVIVFNGVVRAHDAGELFECQVTSPTTSLTTTATSSLTSTATTSATTTTTMTSTQTTTGTTIVGEDEVRLPTIILQFQADKHIADEKYLEEIHTWIKRDIIVGMTSVFEMTDFGTVVDATPQYEDNVGGGGSALASLTPAFEVLFRPVVCRDVAACAAKAELARGEILLTALGSGANNNPNATRVLGDGAGSELALQTMALGSRVMDKPAPTEPPPKVPTPVYVYFLIGFGCLILVVFTYTAVANLRHAADTPQVNGGPAVKDGYKKPRTLTFRTGRRATDVVGSPLSGKLAVTDESDADSSLRRISRADGDRPPAWQPPPSFDAASPIQPYAAPPEFNAPMLPPPPLVMPVAPPPPAGMPARTGAGGHISTGEMIEDLPAQGKVGKVKVVDLGQGGYNRGSKGWKKIEVPADQELPPKTHTIVTSQFC